MSFKSETLEGHVVDIACLRRYPQDEMAQRAQVHTKRCALMGHCVESGYGLVQDDGRVALLEAAVTPDIVKAIAESNEDAGIRLRASREQGDHGMQTVRVERVTL